MECLCMRSRHTALLSNICTTVQILHETIQQKKNSETDTQVQTTLLKISILKNTPNNWRLLHRNFSNDK